MRREARPKDPGDLHDTNARFNEGFATDIECRRRKGLCARGKNSMNGIRDPDPFELKCGEFDKIWYMFGRYERIFYFVANPCA